MQYTDFFGFVKRLNYKELLKRTEEIFSLSTVYFQDEPRWKTVFG
jgi:hypothetical protein